MTAMALDFDFFFALPGCSLLRTRLRGLVSILVSMQAGVIQLGGCCLVD